MKFREGFVSNSSSSSFVLFGKTFNNDEFMKRFNFTNDEMSDIDKNGLYKYADRFDGLCYVGLKGNEWIAGSMLEGDSETISYIVVRMTEMFGPGCKFYHGFNSNGDTQFGDAI